MCHVTSMLTLVAFAMISSPCDATDVKDYYKNNGTYVAQHYRRARTATAYTQTAAQTSYNTDLFDKVKNALVIIRGSRGVGSGVFIKMDDGVWLVTNEHVARCGTPLKASTVSGNEISLALSSCFQVASNRDLARTKIADTMPALSIKTTTPNLGEQIWIFGNSDGGGVLTHLTGKVNGIGDDTIEVDAEFVSGNSGSAILDKDGNVLGLATYATRYHEPSKWVKEGTRFNDIRRFGVRFESVTWETVDWKTYSMQTDLLDACKAYGNFLIPICFGDKDLVTDYDVRKSKLSTRNAKCNRALSQLIRQDKKFTEETAALKNTIEKRQRLHSGSLNYPSNDTLTRRKNARHREMLKCYFERNHALREGRDVLKGIKWCSKRIQDDAESLYEGFDYCVRIYNEINNSRLEEFKKEFFKNGISLE